MKSLSKLLLACIAVTVTFSPVYEAYAQRPGTNAYLLRNRKQAEQVPKEARVAMACSKCQTILVKDASEKGFLSWFKSDTEHLCPGCKGKIKYRQLPARKGTKKRTYVHTCSNCGDESAYCCSTQPGKKTKGMEKKADKKQ